MTRSAGSATPPNREDDPLAWMADARCVGVDPAMFFPERGDRRTISAAKAVCAECPVRVDCATYADVAGERHGIWGGLTEHERREQRSHRAWLRGLRIAS